MSDEARVAFVIRSVAQQAMRDAGVNRLMLVGDAGAEKELIERWCELAFAPQGLPTSAASKTELLLGEPEHAALLPLGDLYAGDVVSYCGSCRLSTPVAELAERAGGLDQLDRALRKLLDERHHADAAFQHIPELREPVLRRLQATRFRRAQLGIVPKLGARTIGVDLFI